MKKTDPDPKKKKYEDFKKADKSGRSAREMKNAARGSSGQYSGGVAPRVGSDKKKGTVKVSKPSGVSSGWKPSKMSTKSAAKVIRKAGRKR